MAKEADKKKVGNAYVKTEFHDLHDYDTIYAVDQDVSDHARLNELIAAGVVEVHAEPAKAPDPVK